MHKQRLWIWGFGILSLISLFLPWFFAGGMAFSGWDLGTKGILLVAMIVGAMVIAVLDEREAALGYIQLLLVSMFVGVFALFAAYQLYNLSVSINELRAVTGLEDSRLDWGIYIAFGASLVCLLGVWILRDSNAAKANNAWFTDDLLDD